jgi:hypothetical protein
MIQYHISYHIICNITSYKTIPSSRETRCLCHRESNGLMALGKQMGFAIYCANQRSTDKRALRGFQNSRDTKIYLSPGLQHFQTVFGFHSMSPVPAFWMWRKCFIRVVFVLRLKGYLSPTKYCLTQLLQAREHYSVNMPHTINVIYPYYLKFATQKDTKFRDTCLPAP